jgi:hypothetical protein
LSLEGSELNFRVFEWPGEGPGGRQKAESGDSRREGIHGKNAIFI